MTFDSSKIELQEHVPLTYNEKEKYLQQTKDMKRVAPIISTFTTGALLFIFYWANDWKISGRNNEDYIVFFIGMLLSFYFVYGSIYSYAVYEKNKFLKDFKNGKQILTSFIVNRDKTEYDTMLTFALPNGNEARLFASDEDYAYFRKGDFVQVTFLASSRVIVKIEMIEKFLE